MLAAVDLRALRELAWSGVPPRLRGTVWKLLLGYLPAERSRRRAFLARKRAEYAHFIPAHYEGAAAAGAAVRGGGGGNGGGGGGGVGNGRKRGGAQRNASSTSSSSAAAASLLLQPQHLSEEAAALRQVQVDAPRTAPRRAAFREGRRPSGARPAALPLGGEAPRFRVRPGHQRPGDPAAGGFLRRRCCRGRGRGRDCSGGGGGNGGGGGGSSSNNFNDEGGNGGSGAYSNSSSPPLLSPDDPAWAGVALPEGAAEAAEADAYWCLCRLLEGVQDHYTHGQPGIRRCSAAVDGLVAPRRLEARALT